MLRGAVSRHTLKGGGGGGSSGNSETLHPNLGLHSAASSGNIGLVKYALENGQPASSNLNGILPLHAACSGGSEVSVRMLLMYGADVNAPRLKSKGSGGGPGAEGSTPLHFAAANGHTEIVRILLEYGARPAATDKDGLQAEALALGNGHMECVSLIRSWIAAYGTNGLAGIASPAAVLSRDAGLSPGSYIRGYSVDSPAYHAAGDDSYAAAQRRAGSPLRNQRSFEHVTAGMKAGIIGRRNPVSKVTSNPNLKQVSHTPNVPPLPFASSSSSASPGFAYPQTSSPSQSFSPLPERSPSPLASADDPGFSTSTTPAGMGQSSPLPNQQPGSRRRPSLPSILEKAAHPAASLRAALAPSVPSSQASLGSPGVAEEADRATRPDIPPSPNRRPHRVTGKRSLSNILRKATGVAQPVDSSSSVSASTPSRQPKAPAEAQATTPSGSKQRGTAHVDLQEEFDISRPTTAPHNQTSFAVATDASSDSNAIQMLRSTSSSSALSSHCTGPSPYWSLTGQPGRTRSTSNDLSVNSGRQLSLGMQQLNLDGSGSVSGHIAGDAAGTGLTTYHPALGSPSLSETKPAVPKPAGSANGYRPRKSSNLSAPTGLSKRMATEESESGSEVTSSDGIAHPPTRSRSTSGASASQRKPAVPTSFAIRSDQIDPEDAQEFLGETVPLTPEEAAGEHHDDHHLPAGLRTLSAIRSPRLPRSQQLPENNAPWQGSGIQQQSNPPSPSVLPLRSLRNRSTSSLSTTSVGSQPSCVNAPISLSESMKASPSISPRMPAVSIADEVGMGGGHGNTLQLRRDRSGSQAESEISRPSTSSLRSNYVSAAEQAQAILNLPEGNDGTFIGGDGEPVSLAAQLAAYGEALAQERKKAGEPRSASSPGLMRRTSSAALKQALPSVSEDAPPKFLSNLRREYSASTASVPLVVTSSSASQRGSYERLTTSRPHSSEGTESRSAASSPFKAGMTSVSEAGRSKTLNEQKRNPGLRELFLDKSLPASSVSSERFSGIAGLAPPLSPTQRISVRTTPTAGAPPILRQKARDAVGPVVLGQRSQTVPLGRASEDMLRSKQREGHWTRTAPSHPTSNEPLPKTPVTASSASFDIGPTSPGRSAHKHSPSLPTDLAGYGAQRGASSNRSQSEVQRTHVVDGDTPPTPPRKDFIPGRISSLAQEMSSPPPSRFSSVVGLGFDEPDARVPEVGGASKERNHPSSAYPPSMPRSETGLLSAVSAHREEDEASTKMIGSTSSRRRMVRNFLSGIKGSSVNVSRD